jgi:hypothetical protein|tara:strand:+ start:300 stop:944 length:645 start_codon:yes stop_codon:yes gene_type:complete
MNYYELADAMARRFGLDPELFRRQIQQESGFQESAVSPVGARGLGQIMPDTAAQPGYGVTPLSADLIDDPEENLRFSAEYMAAMLKKYDGDYRLALAAYNAGAGAVDKAGGVPDFEETQNYVSKILRGETVDVDKGGRRTPFVEQEAQQEAQQEAGVPGLKPGLMEILTAAVSNLVPEDDNALTLEDAQGLEILRRQRRNPLDRLGVASLGKMG